MGQNRYPLVEKLLKLLAWILLVRLAVLWVGLAFYTQYSDWRQLVGYLALVSNSLLEAFFVRRLRGELALWAAALSGAVVISSVLLAAGLTWIRMRLGSAPKT